MATCKILLSEPLRISVGGKTRLKGNGATVAEVLTALGVEHPQLMRLILHETGRFRNGLTVFLNGADIRYGGGLNAAVKEGDTLNLHAPLLVG